MPGIDTEPDLPDPTRSGSTTLIQGVSKSAYGMSFLRSSGQNPMAICYIFLCSKLKWNKIKNCEVFFGIISKVSRFYAVKQKLTIIIRRYHVYINLSDILIQSWRGQRTLSWRTWGRPLQPPPPPFLGRVLLTLAKIFRPDPPKIYLLTKKRVFWNILHFCWHLSRM